MTRETLLKDLGLDENSSPSEIQSTIEDKQSEIEYMIAAIDDDSVRDEYINKIEELKSTATLFLEQQALAANPVSNENVHQLPIKAKSLSEQKSANYADIKAKMSGKPLEAEQSETNEGVEIEPEDQQVETPAPVTQNIKPNKAKKSPVMLSLVVMIALGAIGTTGYLVNNGTLSFSTSEEQAVEIASVEMIRGEIGSFHQLILNAKQAIDLSLANLPSAITINKNAFNELTNSSVIANLEGKTRMGESFLEQGHYSKASEVLGEVKAESKLLLSQYKAADKLIALLIQFNDFDNSWMKLQSNYELIRPTEVIDAETALADAHIAAENGDFKIASESMKTAIAHWQTAFEVSYSQIEKIQDQRQLDVLKDAEIAEEDRIKQLEKDNDNRLELELQAQELKRLADLEASAKEAEAQAKKDEELAKIALIEETDRLSQKLTPKTIVQPSYPKGARKSQTEGWVDFGFTVTSTGQIQNLVILNSNPRRVFNKAATSAFKQWTFSPLLKNGKAIERSNAKYRVEFLFE